MDSAIEKETALKDLNIRGFAGKFKTAKEMVNKDLNDKRVFEDGRHLLPFWERVRLYFFELGGEKIGQKYGDRC